MSGSENNERKKMSIEDASKFMEELRSIIEEAVHKVMSEEIAPVKEALNQVLVEKEYTIKEVAAITGKHHKTIRNWVDDGDLEGYKLGKTWMIKHSKLEEFKNARLDKDPYDKIFKTL